MPGPPTNRLLPDRSLLSPQFEGYKLNPLSQTSSLSLFALPGTGVTQSTVSGLSHRGAMISYREVESRIGFNHLAVGEGVVAYVGRDGSVILVSFDEVCYQLLLLL